MASITDKLRQLIRQATRQSSPTAAFGEDEIVKLMHLLDDDASADFSCEATFNLLDEYAELAAVDEAAAVALMPLVKSHLDKCVKCCGAYEMLVEIMGDESLM
jgi:hypothetical protein